MSTAVSPPSFIQGHRSVAPQQGLCREADHACNGQKSGRSHGVSLIPFWKLGKQPKRGLALIEFSQPGEYRFDFVASGLGVCQVQISILMLFEGVAIAS